MGLGYRESRYAHLVLAVAIATSGTASHLDGIEVWFVVGDDEEEEMMRAFV
jgi:hypothetical protein